MDWTIELVAIPVTDIDRAKEFYTEKAGFNADHDHVVSDEIHFVQLTPPGSACSIDLGLPMVVADIEAARAGLVGRGMEISDIQDYPWGRFIFFQDPDGNGWGRP
jgi:catechol 2,3-dioxygenase-like lactoylglutathione lyase family enzyme